MTKPAAGPFLGGLPSDDTRIASTVLALRAPGDPVPLSYNTPPGGNAGPCLGEQSRLPARSVSGLEPV